MNIQRKSCDSKLAASREFLWAVVIYATACMCCTMVGFHIELGHWCNCSTLLFHVKDMSPKVDQTSGDVFSVNNTRQAAVIHYISTQCICNTSVIVKEMDFLYILIFLLDHTHFSRLLTLRSPI